MQSRMQQRWHAVRSGGRGAVVGRDRGSALRTAGAAGGLWRQDAVYREQRVRSCRGQRSQGGSAAPESGAIVHLLQEERRRRVLLSAGHSRDELHRVVDVFARRGRRTGGLVEGGRGHLGVRLHVSEVVVQVIG